MRGLGAVSRQDQRAIMEWVMLEKHHREQTCCNAVKKREHPDGPALIRRDGGVNSVRFL